ncbi:unnamed protein product [Allacma fusca]|uniref:Uncharacterized protein n=1 Tax=Allacma fusca TaxID=39272 RepID=A0A8J2L544_9HEXA|nr:unnamed protein product [Allacma fusca]
MKSFGSDTIPKIIFIIFGLFSDGIKAWNPNMPGGMKLVINGDTFSFSTDICSGGVFFKKPVHIELSCLHGYFLKRSNGCSMDKNIIVGGENYVCQRVNKDKNSLVQALIPVTNPESPLDHTITFFDDGNTLENLRRYTYVQGLEGIYESGRSSQNLAGVIVTNTQKTPLISIENVCYQGQTLPTADAYLAMLPSVASQGPSSTIFQSGCGPNAMTFPWGSKTVHNFTSGYSAQEIFETEKVADLTNKKPSDSVSDTIRTEIWDGLAYCLQAKMEVSTTGGIKMAGIEPSIESLKLFCPRARPENKNIVNGKGALRQRRRARSVGNRKRREVETSIEFNTLMTCVSTCWKENHDKCHENIPQMSNMPFCPPYCGGKKRSRHPDRDVPADAWGPWLQG